MLSLTVFLFIPWVRHFFTSVGLRWLYIFFLSFSLSFCLTPVFRWLAFGFNILDRPGGRKTHPEATPLLGGSAIFIAFIAAIMINGIFSRELGAILIASAVLFFVGLIDDVKEIPAGAKLLVQILCALFVITKGVVLRVFPDYFGVFSLVCNSGLTVFWLIGITNAMNFFDGMDGMAAGLGVIISFFLGVVSFQTQHPFIGWISVAMMGSCIGFLPYNLLKKRRATIFLGDAGSTILGFILACVAVYGEWAEGGPVVALAAPLLIFWVLIFDMIHISIDRILSGKVKNFREWIEYAGRDHLHHRIAHVLGGQKRSVFFIYLLSLCLGASAVVLLKARTIDALLLLGQACLMVALITVLERRGRALSSEFSKYGDRSREDS
jgi:UDP-GlcNAc:undecaprenyl-phosphate/decaprenyl-phosphate GlcNAc-1-phosphate transferase